MKRRQNTPNSANAKATDKPFRCLDEAALVQVVGGDGRFLVARDLKDEQSR